MVQPKRTRFYYVLASITTHLVLKGMCYAVTCLHHSRCVSYDSLYDLHVHDMVDTSGQSKVRNVHAELDAIAQRQVYCLIKIGKVEMTPSAHRSRVSVLSGILGIHVQSVFTATLPLKIIPLPGSSR